MDSDVRISLRALAPRGLSVAVSPHYYYPTDKGWKFEGALEKLMHGIGMFDRRGPYVVDGFEVAVVKDATAAAVIPDGDGYLAAITNFRFIANAVWTTEETLARLRA